MSNFVKSGMKEIFNFWMKQITKEYQKEYGFDMGVDNKKTWDNESDAFRHTYMQAFLTIYCGEDNAKNLGDEHEHEGLIKRHNSNEANMDLWNNNQGREIGLEITNELFNRYGYKINYFELYPTIKNMIAERVMQRMKAGQLITNPNDKRRYVPKNKIGNPTGYAAPVSSSVKSFVSNQPVTKAEKSQTPSQNFSDIIRQ